MNKKKYLMFIPLSILGVVSGVILFTFLFTRLTGIFEINDVLFRIEKLPHFVLYWVGAANIATFLLIFILGILRLKPHGAIGYSRGLVTKGIYRYVRNPMYAGLSLTLFGLGFLLQNLGVSIVGLFWLLICYFQSRREERELIKRFGDEYQNYKDKTPCFIPNFKNMIFDWLKITSGKKSKKLIKVLKP
ncbi:MAG: isoprenylcysteine carboxylmethyltransferase family protein [Actinobacteria bacterium]|nr:isoprenylcysteine carboxylmethyltransferase family protein [Actinomycetota bacterium]